MNIDLTDISTAVYNRKVTTSQILWDSFMTVTKCKYIKNYPCA